MYTDQESESFEIDIIYINSLECLNNLIEKIIKKYNIESCLVPTSDSMETKHVLTDKNIFIFKKYKFSDKNYTITDLLSNTSNLEESIRSNNIFDESRIFIEVLIDKKDSKFLKVSF